MMICCDIQTSRGKNKEKKKKKKKNLNSMIRNLSLQAQRFFFAPSGWPNPYVTL